MAEERIVIHVDDNGKISAQTEGFKGDTCLKELETLLEGVGDIAKVKKTDDFFQQKQSRTIKQTVSNRG